MQNQIDLKHWIIRLWMWVLNFSFMSSNQSEGIHMATSVHIPSKVHLWWTVGDGTFIFYTSFICADRLLTDCSYKNLNRRCAERYLEVLVSIAFLCITCVRQTRALYAIFTKHALAPVVIYCDRVCGLFSNLGIVLYRLTWHTLISKNANVIQHDWEIRCLSTLNPSPWSLLPSAFSL